MKPRIIEIRMEVETDKSARVWKKCLKEDGERHPKFWGKILKIKVTEVKDNQCEDQVR